MSDIDADRAQIDLTGNLSLLRVHLRRLESIADAKRQGREVENLERMQILAKNFRNQAMQMLRKADEIYFALK
jgi:hypothetical protein